jgi:YVTN family beta-propeller protein
VTPDGARVYVTSAIAGTVSVIDTVSNTVTATVPVGALPYGVAVTPDGARVYVANGNPGTVSVIDTVSNSVTATVTVGNSPTGLGQFIGPAPALAPAAVPTMTEWAMILLGVVLAGGAALTLHRRRTA